MEPIEQRLREESEAAHLIAEIRGAVQNMFFKTEVVEKTEAALLSGAVLDACARLDSNATALSARGRAGSCEGSFALVPASRRR